MDRHRASGAGARLQGPPRLHHADLRCRGRRHRPDRSQGKTAGRSARLTVAVIPGRDEVASPESITTIGSVDSGPAPTGKSRNDDCINRRYFAGPAAALPPVGTSASAVLVDFAG